jgi:ATP-dependent DNA helicase PIF1
VQLDASQHGIVKTATLNRSANVFISGSAGTGKSLVLREIMARLPTRETLVTAPTGVAAMNIGGVTLHSALGIKPAAETGDVDKLPLSTSVARKLQNCTTLVIDEVSMLSPQLFAAADKLCRRYKMRPLEPFGGVRVVLCGDFLQLPPVGDYNNPTPAWKYCFEVPTWSELNLQPAILRNQYRQDDPEFIRFLGDVRVGKFDTAFFKELASHPASNTAVRLRCTNREVDAVNSKEYAALPSSAEHVYEARVWGPMKDAAASRFAVLPKLLTARIGTRVMLLKNLDVPRGLVNGAVGTVVRFAECKDTLETLPVVNFDGLGEHLMVRQNWEVEWMGKKMCTVNQVPLRHAWCLTVHKAQGTSLREVDVDLASSFDTGQAYVALSRARTRQGLTVRSATPRSIKHCAKALDFEQRLLAAAEGNNKDSAAVAT